MSAPFNRIRQFVHDPNGSATVEFVLWLPVFFLVLMLTVDSSRFLFSQTNMWRAASDTTRMLAVGALSSSTAPAYAQGYALAGETYAVTVTNDGTKVSTTISVPISDISVTGVFSFALSSNMRVRTTQRIEPVY